MHGSEGVLQDQHARKTGHVLNRGQLEKTGVMAWSKHNLEYILWTCCVFLIGHGIVLHPSFVCRLPDHWSLTLVNVPPGGGVAVAWAVVGPHGSARVRIGPSEGVVNMSSLDGGLCCPSGLIATAYRTARGHTSTISDSQPSNRRANHTPCIDG